MAVLLFSTCENLVTPNMETENISDHENLNCNLTVNLTSESTRSILPSIDMTMSTFDITGAGPGGASFSSAGENGTTFTAEKIVTGSWIINVTARNAAFTEIMNGSATVEIISGDNTVSVDVYPLTDEGTFNLNITWPIGEMDPENTSVISTFTKVNESSIALSVVDEDGSALCTQDFPSGYYLMKLRIEEPIGHVVFRMPPEAVRIIAGEQTSHSFSLVLDNMVLLPHVADPEITPVGGSYNSEQTVSLSSATAGSLIRYTVSGEEPSRTTGTLYGSPFSMNTSGTVKAMAYKADYIDSDVSSEDYTLVVSAPSISPLGETFNSEQTVALSCITPDALIRYTTNGDAPTSTNGTIYNVPFIMNTSGTIKAIAYKTSWNDSTVSSEEYILVLPHPVIGPVSGTYSNNQIVDISCSISSAETRYTTNGDAPTSTTGFVYSSPFTVSESVTIRAIATLSGWSDSDIEDSVITLISSNPEFSLEYEYTPPLEVLESTTWEYVGSDVYVSSQSVILTSNTSDTTIRYTTDGTTIPNSSTGTLYTDPIQVDSSQTIKAIAYRSGYNNSAVVTKVYTITGQVDEPNISQEGGTFSYSDSIYVPITTTTPGASIRYTLNGEEPVRLLYSATIWRNDSFLFDGMIEITHSIRITAIGYKTDWEDSIVESEGYTITGPAGGIVFYDKGEYTDGWRYLEAAPFSEIANSIPWGGYGTTVGGTSSAIGAGAANTAAIIEAMGSEPHANYAAGVCEDFSYGGKNDWFLPSIDELEQLYYKKEFSSGFPSSPGDHAYLSSTEHDANYVKRWGWNGIVNYYSDGTLYRKDSNYEKIRIWPIRSF